MILLTYALIEYKLDDSPNPFFKIISYVPCPLESNIRRTFSSEIIQMATVNTDFVYAALQTIHGEKVILAQPPIMTLSAMPPEFLRRIPARIDIARIVIDKLSEEDEKQYSSIFQLNRDNEGDIVSFFDMERDERISVVDADYVERALKTHSIFT